MHAAPIAVSTLCSLVAVVASLGPIWAVLATRKRSRKVIEARLAGLDETLVEIGRPPLSVAWGKAGLTGGAIIHRVVSRTAAGEQRVREWAYDPAAAGALKTFAHGIWIPVA